MLGARQNTSGDAITLLRADGGSVTIPLSGPLHNEKAESLARELQSLDNIIASRNALARSEIDAAILSVANESRNDALKELDLALRIAQQTSAGELDDKVLQMAERYSKASKEVLTSQVPTTIYVTTLISTSEANALLHYVSKGDYDAKNLSWISYSEGDKLRIGRYVFRVEPPNLNSGVYEEVVLVVSDPTKRKLTPLRESTK